MPRAALWTAIRDTLRQEIADGQYRAGDKLPTEADLAARFGVNRHTVRRALADLQDALIVHARRGAGVFVTHAPTEYPIGRRVRFHQNLTAAGHIPAKRILMLTTRAASTDEALALRLSTHAPVHVYEGLSLSDEQPIAHFRSTFPADRFPRMLDELRRVPSVTAGFQAHGIADYTRASTRITAHVALPTQALHLQLPPGAPVLRTESINIDASGQQIEYGMTWFAGDRVTLTTVDDG